MMPRDVGAVIREMRHDMKWSQAKLAKESGVSTGQVSIIEQGQNLSVVTLFKIARALNVKPCILVMDPKDRDTFAAHYDIVWREDDNG